MTTKENELLKEIKKTSLVADDLIAQALQLRKLYEQVQKDNDNLRELLKINKKLR